MAEFKLKQTGEEVQEILDTAAQLTIPNGGVIKIEAANSMTQLLLNNGSFTSQMYIGDNIRIGSTLAIELKEKLLEFGTQIGDRNSCFVGEQYLSGTPFSNGDIACGVYSGNIGIHSIGDNIFFKAMSSGLEIYCESLGQIKFISW